MSLPIRTAGFLAVSALLWVSAAWAAPVESTPPEGVLPTDDQGRPLNLDFETGTLQDWHAEGDAFRDQPIEGDTVRRRRRDMRSNHQGRFWIGGYERHGDRPTGTLTSVPFKVTHRWATFRVGGGHHITTRVELVRKDTGKVFYRTTGSDQENMRLVLVDLKPHLGKYIFIRIVDQHSGGWGHVNFDDFRFHARKPRIVQLPGVRAPLPELDQYPYALLPAEQAARVMKLPPGFSVRVFAAEPDVRQPVAMALDDRGRLWVAEAYCYPRRAPEGQGRDRILIFEDADGDGRFDHRKVFIQGLNLVSGLEVGFGGVWVGAAPYLLFIPDRDGDDRPDGPPQVLLDGWGYQDTHETLNAFIWGPDGWLYGCHGVFTHSLVGKPGTPREKRVPLNCAIWRYHPTRHVFEVFAHGTSNPWGVDFNDYGQAFCTACVIPHLFHVIQGARYHRQAGRHFNPYTYADIRTIADHLHYLGPTPHSGNNRSDAAGGGHAHCGAMIYLGGAWPAKYRGQIFMSNIHGQRINMDLLEPRGSGYVGRHGPDFLLTGDRASQMIALRYGPDGQVYILDWYDMQACHTTDPRRVDQRNGRIYKVIYGQPKPVRVNLAEKSDLELARLQLHRNDWFVRHARRLLQERAATGRIDPQAVQFLRHLATTHSDPTRRLRALWALHVMGAADEALLLERSRDENPYVRGWCVQLLFDRETPPGQAVLRRLAELAKDDPSPVVRLYVASALQRVPPEKRWHVLELLVQHAEDAQDHNLPLMYWYAAEPLGGLDPQRAVLWAVRAGRSIPLLQQFMLRRVAGSGGRASLAVLVQALKQTPDPALQRELLEAMQRALRGQRRAEAPPGWEEVAAALRQQADDQVRLATLALDAVFGKPQAVQRLIRLVTQKELPPKDRRRALRVLLQLRPPQLVKPLLQMLDDPELRPLALAGLAQYEHAEVPPRLLAIYEKLSPEEKRQVLATLCSRRSYALALLDAVEKKRVPGTDLTADLVRQLEYLNDEALSRRLRSVWGTVRQTPEEKKALIARYKKLMAGHKPSLRELALGRAIWAKTCQRCHTLYGTGGNVGPDLTGSNRRNLDYLLENIIDPSAVMAKEYVPHVFLLADGRIVTGLVRQENAKTLTVQTAENLLVLPKDEIEQHQVGRKSMMPEDQLKQFSDQEVAALLSYLMHPRQVPMLATPENAASLFNGKDLTGWHGDSKLWRVEDGQIVGRSPGIRRNSFLVSDLLVEDFELELEVKLVPNTGNSGIQFRSRVRPDGLVEGYQADIGAGWWGKLYEEHGRGVLWNKDASHLVRPEKWNHYRIVARGHHIRTYLNGKLCVDLKDPKGALRGIIALQIHSGPAMEVRFRNLKLRVLEKKAEGGK